MFEYYVHFFLNILCHTCEGVVRFKTTIL